MAGAWVLALGLAGAFSYSQLHARLQGFVPFTLCF
jgi:hypothetical protein